MIMNWRMMPEVTKYMYTDPELTIEKQKRWYKKITKSRNAMFWIIQFDGIDIGVINISDIDYKNKRCEWAYYIADTSFRGRGIATQLECNIYDYIFDKLGLHKVCCEVFCFNEKVIHIHEKFGAVIEGTRKDYIYKNGQFLDIVQMGITKEEWYSIRGNFKYSSIIIEDCSFDDEKIDSKYFIGENRNYSKIITESDIEKFAEVSGDFNPIHIDEIEASKSIFGRRICHGMLVTSYISAILGNEFPGQGTIYLSQSVNFKKPVYIGDTVTIKITVKDIKRKDIIVLETNVFNQHNEIVISGEATVKTPC